MNDYELLIVQVTKKGSILIRAPTGHIVFTFDKYDIATYAMVSSSDVTWGDTSFMLDQLVGMS